MPKLNRDKVRAARDEDNLSSVHTAFLHRLLLPLLFAIAAIAAIEFSIQLIYHPSFWQKTTWLLHDPYRYWGEVADRDFTFQKLRYVEDIDPEIISVGDSSGFFSLQSTIVNRYTNGHKYLSLNTGANQAYDGYKGIAEYMLRRSPHVRYVVLYLFPLILPSEIALDQADLGPILNNDLVGINSSVAPPSAGLSPYAKSLVFKGRRFHLSDPLVLFAPGLQYWATSEQTLGWLPEFDVRFDRIDGRVPFHSDQRSDWYHRLHYRFALSDPSMINVVLDDFAQMVHNYGAQLVIAFGPFPERAAAIGDPNIPGAELALARFQREHPDVKFLFPLITRWGSEKFGMYNHISREYTFLSSERLGKALAQLLTDPDSIKPFAPSYRDPGSYEAIETKMVGPPDKKLLDGALALYLYASTADESYRRLISKRVLNLLDREPAFRYMMEDARYRAASLAQRGIAFGFNLSGLQATPVAVSGMTFCNAGPDVQWTQIDGNVFFSYKSDAFDTSGPVPWPASSHVLIPTILEDGIPKFDGYCPEPSMSGAAETTAPVMAQ
jgi:hypothetical protein